MNLVALFLSLVVVAAGVDGAGARVVVVADAPGKLVDDAVAGLKKDGRRVEVRVVVDGAAVVVDGDGADAVYLAAGPRASAALARASTSANASVRRAAFLVKAADANRDVATVALDASFDDQLAWLKTAFPGRTRVIVPRSKPTSDAALMEAAKKAGMTLVLVDVKSAGECVPAVDAALKRAGPPATILLVPDAVAVTPDTVAPLVQDALAARTPVVGFSTYFLKVGAIGAVAVDAASMARQAYDLATATTSTASARPGTPEGSARTALLSPSSGHLVVDGRLAERLGITVKDGPGVEVRR